jgi:hypothetical protein
MKNLISILVILCFVFSCSENVQVTNHNSSPPPAIIEESEKIFIVDGTGKEWDITHAVNEYGFRPELFDFGLGPFAIRPIQDPKMLSPGDVGYPSSDLSTAVIGVTLNGETRAYPLDVLRRHEIANEQFGINYVSVAY